MASWKSAEKVKGFEDLSLQKYKVEFGIDCQTENNATEAQSASFDQLNNQTGQVGFKVTAFFRPNLIATCNLIQTYQYIKFA